MGMARSPRRVRARVSAWATVNCAREARRDREKMMRLVRVMMPRPPTWMSPRMATSPKALQWLGVSTTASPVMQSADMAVKAATQKPAGSPDSVAAGDMSSSVPTAHPTR